VKSPRSAADRPKTGSGKALCPDCDGAGLTLVPFAACCRDDLTRIVETAALRQCAVCHGEGWYHPSPGR
jgi:hypothetical protein